MRREGGREEWEGGREGRKEEWERGREKGGMEGGLVMAVLPSPPQVNGDGPEGSQHGVWAAETALEGELSAQRREPGHISTPPGGQGHSEGWRGRSEEWRVRGDG